MYGKLKSGIQSNNMPDKTYECDENFLYKF